MDTKNKKLNKQSSFSLLFIIKNISYYLLVLILILNHHYTNSYESGELDPSIEPYLLERLNLNLNDLTPSGHAPYISSTSTAEPKLTNINSIKYYNGYLYIAAQNWLLKLNANTLKIEQSIRYGPVLDSPMCRYNPIEECSSAMQTKHSMNNFNKLLIVYESKQALLTCWTAKQGVCDLRDLNDITQLIQNSSIPAVANDPFNSTVGFIASAPNSQDLFYVASTHNSFGPYRDEVPALAGRSLNTQNQLIPSFSSSSANRFMQILTSNSQGLKSSKASIEFISRFSKSFIVKYVTAFNLGIYNYFLSVQHMDTEPALRGDLLITKLARLCLNDLSFTKSYTEMPLRCTSGSSRGLRSLDYNELISAKLVSIRNLESRDEFEMSNDHYIVGLFQETSRRTFNATLESDSVKQAVCVYPLKYVQAKIKENLRKCYDSGASSQFSSSSSSSDDELNIMRGLSFIKPDQRCNTGRNRQSQRSSDYSSSQIGDDFCSSADNGLYPIGGQIPAVSNAILEFNDASFDTIQAYSDSVATSLILMSNKQDEIRYYHFKSLTQSPVNYRTVKLKPASGAQAKTASSNLQFEIEPLAAHSAQYSSPPSLFVATSGNQILKLRMSACESYKTCGECLLKSATSSNSGDPYCGWCSALNECTSHFKCMNAEISSSQAAQDASTPKWINGGQIQVNESSLIDSMCVDIQSVSPAVSYKDRADWIEVNFRKELGSESDNSSASYQCVFMSPVDTITIGQSAKLSVFKPSELRTDAIRIAPNKLKCALPHSTKLIGIFQSNEFKQQRLVLSDDGIFKVSPTSSYYYETQYDRIVLPFYVQNTRSANIQYGTVSPSTSSSKSSSLETSFNITIIDCGVHKSCVSCASAQCQWCSNKCLAPTEQAAQCASEISACKSFDTGTSKLLIPYTAHRQQAPLVFSLLNLNRDDVFSSRNEPSIECIFTMFNGRFVGRNVSMPFVFVNKTHAHCSLANVFNSLSVFIDETNSTSSTLEDLSNPSQSLGQVQTNLRLYDSANDVFIDSISNGKLSLLFYKCEIKANDCSQCLSLNRQLSCMWCNAYPLASTTKSIDQQQQQQSSCRFMNAQSKLVAASQCIAPITTLISSANNQSRQVAVNQCDKPQIASIQPSKIPVGGGTLIIINGLNLGSTIDDVLSVNVVCGSVAFSSSDSQNMVSTRCDLVPSKYVPSKQIACKTRQSSSGAQKQCKVSVKLRSNLLIGSGGATADWVIYFFLFNFLMMKSI